MFRTPRAGDLVPKNDLTTRDLGRFGAFSDGVLAIAITLLVLNFRLPDVDGSKLPSALLHLWPDLLSYALSFAVVGRFWIVHHRIFSGLGAVDGALVTLNLVFLALAALMPFASEVLARYGDEPAAAMAYGAVITLGSLTSWMMVNLAKRRGLVEPSRAEASRHFGTRRALVLPGILALSIPVALLSPLAAELMWIASFAFHPARVARHDERQA